MTDGKSTIERGCWNCCNLFKKTITHYNGKVETSFRCKKIKEEEGNMIALDVNQLTQKHRDIDGTFYRQGCNCDNYESNGKEKVKFT